MAFNWRPLDIACDRQRGIIIRHVWRFDDVGPEGPHRYRYSQGELTFEFSAMAHHDWRVWTSFARKDFYLACVAIYVIENMITFRFPHSGSEYEQLKQNIRDGMLCLISRGGEHFRHVPDFTVGFMQSTKDVPDRPTRPPSLDNLIETGTYEGPLSFGCVDTPFVYQECLVEDPESGTTITSIRRFEGIRPDDPLPYAFAQGGLEIEFRASKYREWRNDGEKLTRPHTATYLIEDTIDQALRSKSRILTSGERHELMENVRAGMWAIETRCGDALRAVPDFQLRFVCRAEDVPRWPPRPFSTA